MLTDTRIRKLKPRNKLYRIADSSGLALEIKTSGKKIWRYRYRFDNKASMVSIGDYPLISLAKARIKRDEFKTMLSDNINPAKAKAEQKTEAKTKAQAEQAQQTTFSDVFYQWHKQASYNWSDRYTADVIKRSKCHLLPDIGDKAISAIDTDVITTVLLKIDEQNKQDTLEKVRSIADRVFRYGVSLKLINFNPIANIPKEKFNKKKEVKHYATITDPKQIGGLLRLLDNYHGTYQVATALKLAPYLFLRPSELAGLMWDEIDFNDNLIRISAKRMKMARPHLVPMAKQVITIIKELHNIKTDSPYLFPSNTTSKRPIVAESLRGGLRRLGLSNEEMTTHGFRHMASTRLYEMGYKGDAIELQLAHSEGNKIKAAYNHAEHLEYRRDMMNEWADYLDKLEVDYEI